MFGVVEWKVTRSSPTTTFLSVDVYLPFCKTNSFMKPRCSRFVKIFVNWASVKFCEPNQYLAGAGQMSNRQSGTSDGRTGRKEVPTRECQLAGGGRKTNHGQNPSSLAEAGRIENQQHVGSRRGRGAVKGLG